jgi:hypothetical protein
VGQCGLDFVVSSLGRQLFGRIQGRCHLNNSLVLFGNLFDQRFDNLLFLFGRQRLHIDGAVQESRRGLQIRCMWFCIQRVLNPSIFFSAMKVLPRFGL